MLLLTDSALFTFKTSKFMFAKFQKYFIQAVSY